MLCEVNSYGNMSMASGCVACPALEDGSPSGHTAEGGDRMRTCCPPGMWADAEIGHETCFDCAKVSATTRASYCDSR